MKRTDGLIETVLVLAAIALVAMRIAGVGDVLLDPIAALLDTGSSGYEDCYAQHAGCRGG